ncbi:unnamed protein product [Clonostachys rhizophaga]|uniref:HNH nuclease domain-containing protein n=1 Tax=Clonostachys rhizophaga TaxID=160324 RepID=A0A9N9VVD0_9HYPO|nr:unnamed protein product [Clonostachys rhizophaga]
MNELRNEIKHERRVSSSLKKRYESLRPEVERRKEMEEQALMDPLDGMSESLIKLSIELEATGVEKARSKKRRISLEREYVLQKQDAGRITANDAKNRLVALRKRYFAFGSELWDHHKRKSRLEDPKMQRCIEPGGSRVSMLLLDLYRARDGLGKQTCPNNWRRKALQYYGEEGKSQNVWCHALGESVSQDQIKTAHIVPSWLDDETIGSVLFGTRSTGLAQPANSLLLHQIIQRWFDKYQVLIVPVDTMERPIKRWKIDVISTDIANVRLYPGKAGGDLDGQELTFLNDNRPASGFLYFRFIMTLVRIKDMRTRGWETVWSKYYANRPFPTPTPYMRKSMLLALATHFETTSMGVIESWMTDHGFVSTSPLELTIEESDEVARIVIEAMDQIHARAIKEAEDSDY